MIIISDCKGLTVSTDNDYHLAIACTISGRLKKLSNPATNKCLVGSKVIDNNYHLFVRVIIIYYENDYQMIKSESVKNLSNCATMQMITIVY